MDTPVIGIKIANGTYFPILQVDDSIKKRVVLTPVSSGQTDVKIDIYRGEGNGMFNPVYVASLILNNIQESVDTGSEIELLVGINEENILDAEAVDRVSGEKQFLSISLDAVDEADFFDVSEEAEGDVPYFSAEIADDDLELEELSSDDTELSVEESFLDETEEDDDDFKDQNLAAEYLYDYKSDKSDKKASALKIAIVFLTIVFILFLVLLVYTYLNKPALSEDGIKEESPTEVVNAAPPAGKDVLSEIKTPVAAAVSEKKEPAAAVPVKKVSAPVVTKKNVKYRIKKGDTLWDISSAYYRTPWLYKKIAEDNKIKNPDLIFTGTYLNIKEK